MTAFYQFIEGEYFFNIGFFSTQNNNTLLGLNVFSNNRIIEENNSYSLSSNPSEDGFGSKYNIRVGNESESFHFTDN